MRILFTSFLMFLLYGQSWSQATFSDDFEAYMNNAYVAASNNKWTTWSNKPGTAEDARITQEFAKSGKQSLKIISTSPSGGDTDLVLPFGGRYTSGKFSFKLSMLVPTDKNAYFNFQATQTVGQTWAIDANFSENGNLVISRSSVPLFTSAYPKDAWFDLEIEINLSSNVWKVILNGECKGAFANGTNAVASVDFYPTNGASLYYIDDVSYKYESSVGAYLVDAGVSDFVWTKGKIAGNTDKPKASLINNGNLVITSADISIDVNGNTSDVKLTGLNLTKGQKLALNLPEITLNAGDNLIEVLISKINNLTSDNESCNNKVSYSLNAPQPAPFKAVLVEEGTGTWCQWCPRGAVFMDLYDELYHKLFIPIAVHNGSTDPMLVPEYNTFMNFSAFPNSKVNRKDELDPSRTEAPFLSDISSPASAKLLPTALYNATTRKLDVSVDVEFLEDASGEYFVSCVITEDGVRGTTSGYNQANAYAGGASGVMGGYELLPNPVPAARMVYHHVARAVSGLRSNSNNSFAGTYKKGDVVNLQYSFTLNAAWNTDSLHIIPILLEGAGVYVNAATVTFPEAVPSRTTETVLDANFVKIYPNPAEGFTNIELKLKKPGNVEIVLTDLAGTKITSKNYGILDNDVVLPVYLNMLNPGVFLLNIKTEEGVRIEKVVVR